MDESLCISYHFLVNAPTQTHTNIFVCVWVLVCVCVLNDGWMDEILCVKYKNIEVYTYTNTHTHTHRYTCVCVLNHIISFTQSAYFYFIHG